MNLNFNKTCLSMIAATVATVFCFASAQAATPSNNGVSTAPIRTERSPKKYAADQNSMSAPQVVEQGDSLFGVRVNQGVNFEGSSILGLNFEHMVRPNLSLGGQFDYATYGTRYNLGGISGRYDYTVYVLNVFAALHFDLFKVRNLDTFVSAGVGRAHLNNNWKSNDGFSSPGNADSDTTFLTAYVNARYFVDSKLGLTASLGTGLGALGFGLDYLF